MRNPSPFSRRPTPPARPPSRTVKDGKVLRSDPPGSPSGDYPILEMLNRVSPLLSDDQREAEIRKGLRELGWYEL